jgi:glycosyltransferase involved in cell wall biosynthesis
MPALVLKTSSATFSITDREDMLNRIEQIKNQIDSDKLPNIYLLHGDLTPEEMNGLYNHPKIKAMISFTKGEGFGRPLLEFSNTGKPTIVSNWSGHVDFMSAYGTMLPGELKQVHPSVVWEGVILEESKWFTVDYAYASNIISDVHKKYKKYQEKSRKQTQYIKENFSLDLMKERFEDIMNEVSSGFTDSIKLDTGIEKLEEVQTYE